MNIDNMNKAIAIMTRAGKINMDNWQYGSVQKSEEDIHVCGTAACFAGWVGVSPEWAADGGILTNNGEPLFGTRPGFPSAEKSLSEWLGLHTSLIEMLIYESAGTAYSDCGEPVYTIYNNISFDKLQASNIVDTLVEIRDLGEVHFLKKQIVNLQEAKECILKSKEYEETTDVTSVNGELFTFVITSIIEEIGEENE